MGGTQPLQTLGQVVEDSEATLFVGRAGELGRLDEALTAARSRPVATYVHGPAGVGKSALLRAHARALRARRVPSVLLDANMTDRTPEDVLRHLARQVSREASTDILPSAGAIVSAINAAADRQGFALTIDAYDELTQCDPWLRGDVFRHLGPGVSLVLAGRPRPALLWSRDLGWTLALREVPLTDLVEDDVVQFLHRCGITDRNVCTEVSAVTGGRPQLLGLAANALLLQPEAAAGGRGGTGRADGEKLASFLIEHILHPSSRRRSWRAGAGASQVDAVVAAAALLPSFERAELIAMIGRAAVEGAWPTLLALSAPAESGGRYFFPDALRLRLEAMVLRQRPWAERQWRRLAVQHHLHRVRDAHGDDDGTTWSQIVHLLRESRWRSWLYPTAERQRGWRAVHAGGPDGAGALDGCRPEPEPSVRAAVDACPEGLLLLRDGQGAAVGYLAAVPLRQDTRDLLGGIPGLEPALAAAGDGEALVWCAIGVADPDAGGEGTLVREALRDIQPYRTVVARWPVGAGRAGPEAEHPLALLGFHPAGDGIWTLDLRAQTHAEWLSHVADARAEAGVSTRQWPTAAKEALQCLDSPDQLAKTAAARYYGSLRGEARPAMVRAWVLDALASGDLGDSPPSERVLLTLYYVDRIGSHEVVAERMNLPRTTYFRCHRQALSRLGACLFA